MFTYSEWKDNSQDGQRLAVTAQNVDDGLTDKQTNYVYLAPLVHGCTWGGPALYMGSSRWGWYLGCPEVETSNLANTSCFTQSSLQPPSNSSLPDGPGNCTWSQNTKMTHTFHWNSYTKMWRVCSVKDGCTSWAFEWSYISIKQIENLKQSWTGIHTCVHSNWDDCGK